MLDGIWQGGSRRTRGRLSRKNGNTKEKDKKVVILVEKIKNVEVKILREDK